MITFADRMYGEALNMLGSDPVEDPALQGILDHLYDLATASHQPVLPAQPASQDCPWIPGHMAPACDWDRDCPVHGLEAVAGHPADDIERTA